MRLFLFNPDSAFSLADIVRRVKIDSKEIRSEIIRLINSRIVKKRSVIKDIYSKKKGEKTKVIRRINELGYSLDSRFPYLQALKNLLIIVSLHADEGLIRKFSSIGKMKLFIASGVFIQEWDTRIDLLIVGDDLNIHRLETVMQSIESEVGKEISYSVFDTEDFEYRLGIHDRLIRDILDSPHTVLIDRIGISDTDNSNN